VLASDASQQTVRRLVSLPVNEAWIFNLVLNLDPDDARVGREHLTQVDSLHHEAKRAFEALHDELTHEQRTRMQRELEELMTRLSDAHVGVGGRAVAVYASVELGLEELLRLPDAAPNSVNVERVVDLRPLVDQGMHLRWGVLVLDHRSQRMLRGDLTNLEEVFHHSDDVGTAGRRDDHVQRDAREEALKAIERALATAGAELEREPYDHLLIAAAKGLRGEIEAKLPPALVDRVGAVPIVEHELGKLSPQAIWETLAPARAEALAGVEDELETVLRESTEPLHVAGLEGVLDAVDQRRVSLLSYRRGARLDGAYSAAGEVYTTAAAQAGGFAVRHSADVLPALVRTALAQDARVGSLPAERAGVDVAAKLRW
jgi:hypothetical protein